MDEGVVEGSEDVRHAEDVLALALAALAPTINGVLRSTSTSLRVVVVLHAR